MYPPSFNTQFRKNKEYSPVLSYPLKSPAKISAIAGRPCVLVYQLLSKTLQNRKIMKKIVLSPTIAHFAFDIKLRGQVKLYSWPQLVAAVHEDICKLSHQPTRMRSRNTAITAFETRKGEHFKFGGGHVQSSWVTHSMTVNVDRRACHCPAWQILPFWNSSMHK